MVIDIFLFILGIILLYKGSGWFVNSTSRIAKHLGVSPFIIGISLVAIGTSIPELSSVITSSIQGQTTLVTGDLIGSSITNITLIFGLILLLGKVKINKEIIKKDTGIMTFVTILFLLLGLDGTITTIEGILLLIIYIGYLSYTFTSKQHKEHYGIEDFVNYLIKFEYVTDIKKLTTQHKQKKSHRDDSKESKHKEKNKQHKTKPTLSISKECISLLIGLTAIILGARWMIGSAIIFANNLGISTGIIGLTIVALGTSAPEISVALRSIKKEMENITIGDVIGSNITNLLLILGIASMIQPITVFKETIIFAGPLLIGTSILMYNTIKTNKTITKKKGILHIGIYILYLIMIILLGTR